MKADEKVVSATLTPKATAPHSPFHRGERAIQARLGLEERMDPIGRKILRDHMLKQHQSFFARLPLLFVGSLDATGQPWASVLAGEVGFAHALHPRALRVNAQALPGDPLGEAIRVGAALGILGIELETRRRNRLNGLVETADELGFSVGVVQSFGNCAKYIQARASRYKPRSSPALSAHRHSTLEPSDRELICRADTFFIATRSDEQGADASQGVDVSHRGGRPGFVSIASDGTLVFPDYVGNFLFNTLGNLETDPRCGLLFIDFERGTLLQLAGVAHVLWKDERIRDTPGAERLVVFSPHEVITTPYGLPFEWEFIDYSPELDRLASEGQV